MTSASDAGLDATVTAVRGFILAAGRFGKASADRAGIGVNDAAVLNHVAAAGGSMAPVRLSRQLRLRSGTLTAILDRLGARRIWRGCRTPRIAAACWSRSGRPDAGSEPPAAAG